MTKRKTHPNNGLESSAPKRRPRDGEQAPAGPDPASTDQQTEAEEMTPRDVDKPSTQEEHGASDALMESYNG
jgi:hypothetical protein